MPEKNSAKKEIRSKGQNKINFDWSFDFCTRVENLYYVVLSFKWVSNYFARFSCKQMFLHNFPMHIINKYNSIRFLLQFGKTWVFKDVRRQWVFQTRTREIFKDIKRQYNALVLRTRAILSSFYRAFFIGKIFQIAFEIILLPSIQLSILL